MVKTIIIQQTKFFFYAMYALFGTITAVGIYALLNDGYGVIAGFGAGFLLATVLLRYMNSKEKEEPESWLKEN